MTFAGADQKKGERNEMIATSIFRNLKPSINVTVTDDHRIVLHRHSFMSYVREEGRRYQLLQRKQRPFRLQLDLSKVSSECFSGIDWNDS